MISHLEHASEFVLQGWALLANDPSVTVFVDIHVDGAKIARVPAGTFRGDLQAAGYGDGYHAFFFNPLDYLTRRENHIEVFESSSGTLLANGSRLVKTELATNREEHRKASLRAQSRWTNPEPSAKPAQADGTLLNFLELAVHFHPALRILEIGPSRRGLLSGILERKKPFSSYLGIDLSRGQVERMQTEFGSNGVRFLTGDAVRYPFPSQVDLIVASSLGSALFPSFLPMLRNTSLGLAPGGIYVFELSIQDDRASISRAEWQGDRWLRLYSQLEIRRLLTEAGLELLQMQQYARSGSEHRMIVSALKLHRRPRSPSEEL